MSSGKKPGFLERWFGLRTGRPEPEEPTPPAKEEPPSGEPARKPPAKGPAKREPPKDRPAKKEPPKRKRTPSRGKPKAPPPAGPAPEPGKSAPEERPPSTREKGSPEAPTPEQPSTEAPKPSPKKTTRKAPPPAAPTVAPGKTPPEEREPGTRKKGTPDETPPDEAAQVRPLPGEGAPEKQSPSKPAEKGAETPKPDEPKDKPKAVVTAPPRRSWFEQLRRGLARSSAALSDNLAGVLTKRKLDEDTLEELEEVLIKADLGVAMAGRIRTAIAKGRYDRGVSPEAVRDVLAAEIASVLEPVAKPFALEPAARPHVILVVGVNGTGKTTTIGKMAHRFARQGLDVMLAAADTFRAAAIDQLKVWGGRVGAEVIAKDVGADPAGVAYEALEAARAEGKDVLLIDTAGRLQNKSDLMAELAKIVRVLKKLNEAAPHSVVLTLDATTGQNALNQVQIFQEISGVTSLVVTKLDGTARGGILVAIAERFGLPINAIGVGEGLEDLEPFDAHDFARAIAGVKSENEAAA